jgi:hypothetical protein
MKAVTSFANKLHIFAYFTLHSIVHNMQLRSATLLKNVHFIN